MEFDPDSPLSTEIRYEMAQTYFAACRRMVSSLDELKSFDRNFAAQILTQEQKDLRAELLAEACERVYFVVIQREAIQLSHSDTFYTDYEITDEVRRHLGPRPPRGAALKPLL